MPLNQTFLDHTRAEIQGTVQLMFAEGATSLATARSIGYLDYGNFTASEIKAEAKREPVAKARRGVVSQSGTTPGLITLGLELATKEVADARKVRHLLSAKTAADLAQAVIANAAIDALAFAALTPAKLNAWYELTNSGVNVREISAAVLTVGGTALVAGTDYLLDSKVGLVRFINPSALPAASVTVTVTAPAIDGTSAGAMKGFAPMQQSAWRGWARALVWDQDTGTNLVMDYEPRPVEITCTGGTKIDGEKQSELKLMVTFTDNQQRVLVRD